MVFQTIFNLLRPLSEEEKQCLELLKEEPEFQTLKNLIKQKKISLDIKNFNLSITEDYEYYQLASQDQELNELIDKTNIKLKKLSQQEVFKQFAEHAFNIIPNSIAPSIQGLDSIKRALTLQLFASENIHILLVGDTGTGKTDLLKSVNSLAQHSVYGSGSNVNLAYTLAAESIQPGILARADKGICAIDDLNLTRRDERSALISAMEKGFVTINKLALQAKFDARIRLLAASNAVGSIFSRTMESMKKQIPFESSFLQKFNLIFIIRQADIVRSTHAAKKSELEPSIKSEDLSFVKDYIQYAETTIPEVTINPNFEQQANDLVNLLKKRDYKYLLEVTPKFSETLIKLSKASARLELRNEVTQKDFDGAKLILELSLQI